MKKFEINHAQISRDWAEADEISDRVIEILNERGKFDVPGTQLLVGVLLGLLGLLNHLGSKELWPTSLVNLHNAAGQVIDELMQLGKQGELPKRGEDQ